MRSVREAAHPRCVACSPESASGLKLEFHDLGDGTVRACFHCSTVFQGYPGRLHGGIISTILDSAMTHCLFVQGHQAVTAELSVRFRAPVFLGQTVVAEARMARELYPLFCMEATLLQDGELKATATAKFMVP